jgi:hypothetical protein
MMRERSASTDQLNNIKFQAAGVSLAAGMLHLFATFDYWAVWAGYALFFMVVALLQVTYGLAMFFQPWAPRKPGSERPADKSGERLFLLAGALVTGAIVVLWLFAHLAATPIGPQAGERQPITLLSVAAVVAMAVQTWYLLRLIRLLDGARPEPALHETVTAQDD